MADEITYAGLDEKYTYPFRLMRDSMIEALYDQAGRVLPFLKRKSIAAFASDSERFPKAPKLVAGAVNDGTDLGNTAYSPSQVTLTVGEVGLMLTLTDLARTSSIVEWEEYGREAGMAVAEKLMIDVCALGAGFSDTVGTSGSALTEAQFREARTNLVIRKIPGPYFAVLYPQQMEHLYDDMGTTLNPASGGGASARAEANDLTVRESLQEPSLYNVVPITSPEVPTANAGADSAGFMAGANRALAYVEKWATRPEIERDASLRASEVVVTSAYAVGETDDDSGVGIITDR